MKLPRKPPDKLRDNITSASEGDDNIYDVEVGAISLVAVVVWYSKSKQPKTFGQTKQCPNLIQHRFAR